MLHFALSLLLTKIKFLLERARFESRWRDEVENDASIDSVDTNRSVDLAYEYGHVEHWERNVVIIRYIIILFYTSYMKIYTRYIFIIFFILYIMNK